MTLTELLKKTEEKFEKEIRPLIYERPQTAEDANENTIKAKSFILSSVEEAYTLGEENCKERIREWAEKEQEKLRQNKKNRYGNRDNGVRFKQLSDLKEEFSKP